MLYELLGDFHECFTGINAIMPTSTRAAMSDHVSVYVVADGSEAFWETFAEAAAGSL